MPEEEYNKIRKLDTPAALEFRTMPDLMVSNDTTDFYLELKVGLNPKNAFFEALPLAVNQNREKILGIPCIYVYGGSIVEGQRLVASYSSDIVPNKLVIPKRNWRIKNILTSTFDCPVQEQEVRKGFSGDAYVSIPAEQVRKWIDLKDFVQQKTPA